MHIQKEWPVGSICVSVGGGGDAGWGSALAAEPPASAGSEAHGAVLPGSQRTEWVTRQMFPLREGVLGTAVTFLLGAQVSCFSPAPHLQTLATRLSLIWVQSSFASEV